MATGDDGQLDEILRALADSTRRRMLRTLIYRPGLTTGQLAESVPGMTRWGVMKHLAVMRAAGLVQTFHDGRRRRHYEDRGSLAVLSEWLRQTGGAEPDDT